ncbi:hypothetical protein MASR1M74_16190 [Lentimicrobium sp.]
MNRTNNFIFTGLQIVAWIIFVGLSVEAGGLLVNFFFSLFKPEVIPKLYQRLDLIPIYRESILVFLGIYAFILSISLLKVLLFYLVIRMMYKMKLTSPFNTFVSAQILNISYCTLSIGILSFIARQVSKKMEYYGLESSQLHSFWEDSQAFILMGAVIYIIAIIFKKGVELQDENDLTV